MGGKVIRESGGNANGLVMVRKGDVEASHSDMRFGDLLGCWVGLSCKS